MDGLATSRGQSPVQQVALYLRHWTFFRCVWSSFFSHAVPSEGSVPAACGLVWE